MKVNSMMSHTDRLGGVVPGDVVVKVGVVRHAPDLEFLPNNTYVFIHLQEDIWRETELWEEMNKDEFKKERNNNQKLVVQHSVLFSTVNPLCMTLMEKALDVFSTPLTLAVQT